MAFTKFPMTAEQRAEKNRANAKRWYWSRTPEKKEEIIRRNSFAEKQGRAVPAQKPKRRVWGCRARAKRLGIEFSLIASDLTIPKVCPVLGIPIVLNCDDEQRNNWPSVDRIDPTQGYLPWNVRVISNRANMLKSNATIAELELILADLKRINS